ncbi:MAG TPA: MqnA/MqnD/SBP family protein [Planctomycetota bacterium]|nr:MqnA/MqnD/SBP family protein [Planctomycetota bacterium]
MAVEKVLSVAHTPDSDDAFMFHALLTGQVNTRGLGFRSVVEDIQTLNDAAAREKFDITALSLHGWVYVRDRYLIMEPGASVGDGYGPILVARTPTSPRDLKGKRIAVPGERTTAALLLRLFHSESPMIVRPFDQIMGAVMSGDAELGLLIHEGQVTYSKMGFHKVIDLGEWWKSETGLPVVLGIVGIRRALGTAVHRAATQALRDSIAYALKNRNEALAAAKRYSRGMDTVTLAQFVSMYVNDFTVDMGESGRRSAALILQLAEEHGMIPKGARVEFAP